MASRDEAIIEINDSNGVIQVETDENIEKVS